MTATNPHEALPIGSHVRLLEPAVAEISTVLDYLGDPLVNARPTFSEANTPAGIAAHCCGVTEYWGGHVIAGRPVHRERVREFESADETSTLRDNLSWQLQRYLGDLQTISPVDPPRGRIPTNGSYGHEQPTQGDAVMHVLEELIQHRGTWTSPETYSHNPRNDEHKDLHGQ